MSGVVPPAGPCSETEKRCNRPLVFHECLFPLCLSLNQPGHRTSSRGLPKRATTDTFQSLASERDGDRLYQHFRCTVRTAASRCSSCEPRSPGSFRSTDTSVCLTGSSGCRGIVSGRSSRHRATQCASSRIAGNCLRWISCYRVAPLCPASRPSLGRFGRSVTTGCAPSFRDRIGRSTRSLKTCRCSWVRVFDGPIRRCFVGQSSGRRRPPSRSRAAHPVGKDGHWWSVAQSGSIFPLRKLQEATHEVRTARPRDLDSRWMFPE